MEAKKIIDVTPVGGAKISQPSIFSSKDSDQRFTKRDALTATTLSLSVFLVYVIGIDAFEFFRHTEADRTLIGWEMYESGNYLVPQLLSSTILTKPPLYYWVLAGAFSFFGEVSEFAARVPSVLFAALAVALNFVMGRLGKLRYDFALLSALAVSTSALFMQLASKAEIDMTYGFFCWAALYAGFFAASQQSKWWSIGGGVLCALAFLVKGPQILAFYALSQILFCKFFLRQTVKQALLRNIWSGAAFVFVVLCWLIPLSQEVGYDTLLHQFDVEVLQRFTSEGSKERGWYYYILSSLGGLLPWSAFLVGALVIRYRDKTRISGLLSAERLFLKYSALTFAAGLVVLSLAEGKSSRYWFPLFCFGTNLCVWAAYYIRNSSYERFLNQALFVLTGICCVAGIVLPIFGYFTFGVLLFFASAYLCWQNKTPEYERWRAVAALVLLVCGIRTLETDVFAEYRNEKYNVPAIAKEMVEAAGEKDVYTVELFSRWLVYYMKQDGVQVRRLSEENVPAAGRVLLLLDGEDELWRLEELERVGGSYSVVTELENYKNKWMLIEADFSSVQKLRTSEVFPTNFSPRYF